MRSRAAGQRSPVGGTSSDQGGVVALLPDGGLDNFIGTGTAAGTTIADTPSGGELIATIQIVPEPGSLLLAAAGAAQRRLSVAKRWLPHDGFRRMRKPARWKRALPVNTHFDPAATPPGHPFGAARRQRDLQLSEMRRNSGSAAKAVAAAPRLCNVRGP